jgi:hypothetical protein
MRMRCELLLVLHCYPNHLIGLVHQQLGGGGGGGGGHLRHGPHSNAL